MIARDRTADLDRLADAVIERMENGGESYFGLDGKRPFGFSGGVGADVMGIIGTEPEGQDDEPSCYSDSQQEYGEQLFDDVLQHIKYQWSQFRAAQRGE